MVTTISDQQTLQFLNWILHEKHSHEYNYKKHSLSLLDELNDPFCYLRLPIHLHFPGNKSTENSRHILVLIQSGSAATGFVENTKLIDHKVFTAYMVRKKQGKSQIKHLKTKGKSRAGSRVRLASTIKFFENINSRLQLYFQKDPIDRIALSCSKTLIPWLFQSKIKCPFEKRDGRIYMIPKDVSQPNYKVLTEVNKFLMRCDVHYEDAHSQRIEKIFADIA
jgi:hypothetical protein